MHAFKSDHSAAGLLCDACKHAPQDTLHSLPASTVSCSNSAAAQQQPIPPAHAGKEDTAAELVKLDRHFEGAYEHLVREALDAQLSLHTRSFVQGDHLLLCLSGPSGPDDAIPNPLAAANDVDILTLVSMIKGEWQAGFGA